MKLAIEESVLRQALEALWMAGNGHNSVIHMRFAYNALRAALDTAEKIEPVTITDAMAYAFHNALTDGALGAGEVDEIKKGLRAVVADFESTPGWRELQGGHLADGDVCTLKRLKDALAKVGAGKTGEGS